MAKDKVDNNSIQSPFKGLYQDASVLEQPKDSYRYLLNGVDATSEGNESKISNERSNVLKTSLPLGYNYLGSIYIGDGEVAVWATNSTTNTDIIGVLDKNDNFNSIVSTHILGLSIEHQIDAIYRIRRGNEKIVYWVDGYNRLRTFNFSSPQDYYNSAYKIYLESGGNPNLYPLEKWDSSSFDLVKGVNSTPSFTGVDILTGGSVIPGSYNFAVQYIDDDLNPTKWLTTSNTVNIYNDSTDRPYYKIRGSKNIQNSAQNFGPTNKSIKVKLANLDSDFPFFRIAIIQATGVVGKVTRALVGEIISTSNPTYTYSGDDTNLTEIPIEDIIIEPDEINSPNHIEQLENRLLVANSKGSKYNWCDFQKFASKIRTDLVTKSVVLNSISDPSNQKNALSSFTSMGYMPGEAYSVAAIYLMSDGSTSPAFHIAGKHNTSNSAFDYYETNSTYSDIHNCANGGDYWGVDAQGHSLKGKKVRHHKFPSRQTASKPLISSTSSTSTITKYRYMLKFDLNTGGGITAWPVDGTGAPKVIFYSLQYKPSYSSTTYTYSSYLTIDDLGRTIVIYDELDALSFVTGSIYLVFDTGCDLIVNYQTTGTPTFTITKSNDLYTVDTIQNAITSDIFGIKFSGVEKPHPDVVGVYFVRHKREDTDRNVIDNAIFGLNTYKTPYKSFGLIIPKVNNTSPATLDNTSLWFFSPEHQFLNKKINFTGIDIQGYYEETAKRLPQRIAAPQDPRLGPSFTKYWMMLIIDDVYPGTSYNADIHKKNEKDDDGFSLAVGYRNYMVAFNSNISGYSLANPNSILYLDAAANKSISSSTYYNTSCDNKIGMTTFASTINTDLFSKPSHPETGRLVYASLTVNNKDAYADFITRTYFKEHNNPFMFGSISTINNLSVYNGDSYISPVSITSSMFWDQKIADRGKKDRTWQIVVGAILIVAGVVAAIFTAGSSIAVTVAAIASLAVSYGISLAMSGISFEQMKNMIDTDYPKGLKDTIKDQDNMYIMDGVIDYPGPQAAYPGLNPSEPNVGDDAFEWFSDRASNIWIESTIPMGLRVGVTADTTDFVNSPNPNFDEEEFKNYLINKFTVIDRQRGAGRLYKGYPSAEVYDINLDYLRRNEEKLFYHLPIEYNCCRPVEEIESFPIRVHYSEQAFQEEVTDNYRVFLPNNYKDIEGESGQITDLFKLNNELFIHTTEGLWHLPKNLQERASEGLITFIGTGAFFSIPPRKILDTKLGSGGTKHKWATVKTPIGVIFSSETEGKVYLHTGDQLVTISDTGNEQWFKNNLKGFLPPQFQELTGIPFPNDNNPVNPNGVGIHSIYDGRLNRVIITKRDYLIRSEYQSILITSSDSFNIDTINLGALGRVPNSKLIYSLADNKFYYIVYAQTLSGDTLEITEAASLDNQNIFENKSWTISYSLKSRVWRSFHSYLPLAYIDKQQDFFSLVNSGIWKHNAKGSYQRFYGTLYPHILEYISVSTPIVTRVWNSIVLQTTSTKDGYDNGITFNKLLAYNSYQSTLLHNINPKVEDSDNYYLNQITNNSNLVTSRTERDWTINEFRDYRTNYNSSIFLNTWNDVQTEFPIDKVLNLNSLNPNKDWTQLQLLRDKFLVIRLIFDNFDDVELTTNYVIEVEQQSFR